MCVPGGPGGRDLPPYPGPYNYDRFSFDREEDEVAYWSEAAPALGSTAPGIVLERLRGGQWRLTAQRGRPVVLEFGSYTCPIFCGHTAAMERLAGQFPEAAFLVVYVREAHPGERTRPHRTMDEKRRLADLVARTEGIRREVLVDSVDGAVHRRWGAGYNSVFVLDAEGHVVVRRFWNEPTDVSTALAVMRDGLRPIPVERTRFGAPSERGPTGSEMLERGGRQAVRDFATDAPPRIIRALEKSTDEVRAAAGLIPARV